jgi:hypothetical protein
MTVTIAEERNAMTMNEPTVLDDQFDNEHKLWLNAPRAHSGGASSQRER